MAINKTSKNRKVMVIENYNLNVGGKIQKLTDVLNIESTAENLTLICNSKINLLGNKK